ncbi:MAG: pilus assembly PilX family protein [Luteimonas sp.]
MNTRPSHFGPSFQRGATLVVVLILLLIMTVLGLAILRGTSLDERMSANMRDRSLSFQAAEAALREGEAIAANPAIAPPATGCAGGVCATPLATATDRWLDTGFTAWRNASTSMGTIATPSTFIVEYMGDAPTWPGCDRKVPVDALCLSPRYRITARSQADGRAQVVLQTNFIVQ